MTEPPPLEALFHAARSLPAGPEREAHLDAACGGDVDLRRQVDVLLRIDAHAVEALDGDDATRSTAGTDSRAAKAARDAVAADLDRYKRLQHGPPASVLQTLQDRTGAALDLHLHATEPEDLPVKVTDEARRLCDSSGRYQVLGEIARGGVGIVYKGRDQDLGRDVAIKVLRDEYDERPDVLARFVEEAQIGGQLQHPGIVPVYELGLQAGERPYFAMKLVKGETLAAQLGRRGDRSADRRLLLGVFEQVCQTLAYAHSRRVVHRDLKPANVMVGAFGEVQVVDWGFAKVLARGGLADERASLARGTSEELSRIETVRSTPGSGSHSLPGSMMGTPAYMPPEQAQGDIECVDERSDVFGLGAILCEILTGSAPYLKEDGDVLRQAAGAQLEPARERLASCGADETLVALCLDCLAPARAARPASAQELASRMASYLTSVETRAQEARVEAAGATVRAVALKRTQRLGIGLTVAIAAGLLVSLWFWREARDSATAESLARGLADDAALAARDSEQLALEEAARANAAEADATARAAELEQVATFQAEQLKQIDPATMGVRLRRSLLAEGLAAGGEDRRASLEENLAGLNFTGISLEVLEQSLFGETLATIDREFEDQPLVQARLLGTMGALLTKLGLLDQAGDPIQRALAIRRSELGDDHRVTLVAMGDLAAHHMSQGRLDEAERLFRETLDDSRRVLGDGDRGTLILVSNLAALLAKRGKLDQAEPLMREALDGMRRIQGDDHPDTLNALSSMGSHLMQQGRLDEAEPFLREALDAKRRVVGDDDPGTLNSMAELGVLLMRQGKLGEAEPFVREALDGMRRVLGDDHPATLRVTNNFNALLVLQGKPGEAEASALDALDAKRRFLGDDHLVTLTSIYNYGVILLNRGEPEEAEPFCREALEGMRRVLGDGHPDTVMMVGTMNVLLGALIANERFTGPRESLAEHLAERGELLLLQRNFQLAESNLSEGLELLIELHGETHWRTAAAIGGLGAARAGQGRQAEAEPLFLWSAKTLLEDTSLPSGQRRFGVELVPASVRRVAEFYEAWHAADPSAGHDVQAAEWRDRLLELER